MSRADQKSSDFEQRLEDFTDRVAALEEAINEHNKIAGWPVRIHEGKVRAESFDELNIPDQVSAYRDGIRCELAREIAKRLRGGVVLARYNPEVALKDQNYLAGWIEREYCGEDG